MKKIKIYCVIAIIASCSVFFGSNNKRVIILSNVEAITSDEMAEGHGQEVGMYVRDEENTDNNTQKDSAYKYYTDASGNIITNNSNGIGMCRNYGYTTPKQDKDEDGNQKTCWLLVRF